MARKVKIAYLQSGVNLFIPGLGELGTAQALSNEKHKDLTIHESDDGSKLIIRVKGREAASPITNFKLWVYEIESHLRVVSANDSQNNPSA